MFEYIINPINNKKLSIHSKKGKNILQRYLQYAGSTKNNINTLYKELYSAVIEKLGDYCYEYKGKIECEIFMDNVVDVNHKLKSINLTVIGVGDEGMVLGSSKVKPNEILGNKVMKISLFPDENSVNEFKQQMAVNSLKIFPQLYFYEKTGAFAVMENIPGITLKELRPRISRQQYSKIIDKILDNMYILYKHGFMHDDLHEGNIMLDKRGNIKFLDTHLVKAKEIYVSEEAINSNCSLTARNIVPTYFKFICGWSWIPSYIQNPEQLRLFNNKLREKIYHRR